jgi:hypothetical protein
VSKTAPHTRISKAHHDKVLTALGTPGLAVYIALCRIQSDAKAEEKHLFDAGARRISRHCGLSVRSIRTYLPMLADLGAIKVQSGRNAGRQSDHEENKVSLIDSAAFALGSAGDAQAPSARDRGENCTRIKNTKNSLGKRRVRSC